MYLYTHKSVSENIYVHYININGWCYTIMFDTLLLADVIANYVYIVTNRLMLLSVMVCFFGCCYCQCIIDFNNCNNNRADVIAMLLFLIIIN